MYLIDTTEIPEDAPIDAEIEAPTAPGVEWRRLPLRSGDCLPDSVRSVLDKPCKVPASFADRVENRGKKPA